jgi:hypothetical protein
MKHVKGVLIFVPAYGQSVCALTMGSLYAVGQALTSKGIRNRLVWFSAADIVDVRNLALTVWYDNHPEFSHLLMVDADMGFEPELIWDMLRFEKPLTGCLYARRQVAPSIVGGVKKENDDVSKVVNGFLPAEYMGAGVMLIERRVVTALLETMPDLSDDVPSPMQEREDFAIKRFIRAFDPIREGNKRLSEDISFCCRWKECGGEMWVNVAHRISHIGPFDYGIRYAGILADRAERQRDAA